MCVIAVVFDGKKRPTNEEVSAMYGQNKDGAGVAWFEGKKLHWHKGLGLDQLVEYTDTLPAPFTIHARIASVGPAIEELTHPFPVLPEAPLDLAGETSDFPVIFHNGTWTEWRTKSFQLAAAMGYRIPTGVWSDTRAMALMAAHFGTGALYMLTEKIVIMDPTLLGTGKEIDMLGSERDWELWENRFWVSNDYWKHSLPKKESRSYYDDTWRKNRDAKMGPEVPQANPTQTAICQLPPPPSAVASDSDSKKGGEPLVAAPFVQPLSFYEHEFARNKLSIKAMTKIRRYFDLVRKRGTGSKLQKPKLMLEFEQKWLEQAPQIVH